MRNRLTNRQAATQNLRREISEDFKYDKKKLKHLQRILHNVNVSVGTLVSALNEFSRVKGPAISPDGLLGGLGYIMTVKGIKEILNSSMHNLSEVADSLADELTNPHWHADDKKTKEIIKEKQELEEKTQQIMDNPDEVIEDTGYDEPEEEETEEEELEEKPEEEKEEPEPEEEEEKIEPVDRSEEEGNIKPEEVKTSTEGLIEHYTKFASEDTVRRVLPNAVKAALIKFGSKK